MRSDVALTRANTEVFVASVRHFNVASAECAGRNNNDRAPFVQKYGSSAGQPSASTALIKYWYAPSSVNPAHGPSEARTSTPDVYACFLFTYVNTGTPFCGAPPSAKSMRPSTRFKYSSVDNDTDGSGSYDTPPRNPFDSSGKSAGLPSTM